VTTHQVEEIQAKQGAERWSLREMECQQASLALKIIAYRDCTGLQAVLGSFEDRSF
jgi:hypothetical protein